MQNAGLDEAQAGIKTAGRNINNLRYTDDTTLMAEGEAELKSLLMKVKDESEKAGLKLHIQSVYFIKLDPWVGKIPWKRKWQATPVCLPREFYGQRSLTGSSPWSRKELDTTE